MLVRLVGLRSSKEPSDQLAAKLLLIGDASQIQESTRMYDILLAMKGKPKRDFLPRVLHKLLKALAFPNTLCDADFQCPTEQVLFLSSITANGFKTASFVKSLCCKMQFCFRVIYLHQVRMEAYRLSEYKPFTKKTFSDSEFLVQRPLFET